MTDTIATLPAITVSEIEGEPRVLDTDLGKALEMARPETIRETIKEHREALEAFGGLSSVAINPGLKGGRPGTAFWLNEEQAAYVTIHLRTPKAQVVKVQLVKVFTAWRRGQLVPAQPSLPNFADPIEAAKAFIVAEEGRRAEEAQKLIAHERIKVLEPLAAVAERVVAKKRRLKLIDRIREGMVEMDLTPWFIERHERNAQNGQLYRYYEMTRDGADSVSRCYYEVYPPKGPLPDTLGRKGTSARLSGTRSLSDSTDRSDTLSGEHEAGTGGGGPVTAMQVEFFLSWYKR
jgi:hypothetical protein